MGVYANNQSISGIQVIPSDTINIPGTNILASGTQTVAGAANITLTDTAANFLGVDPMTPNYIVYNTTTSSVATVMKVLSATTITLSAAIMNQNDAYQIYGVDNNGYLLFVGGAGAGGQADLRVMTIQGNDITLKNIPDSSWIPIVVQRVYGTGTTATNIVALQ